MPSRRELRELAAAREALHRRQASHRPLSPDSEYLGLVGEWAFSRRTGLPMDLSLRVGGDHGIDFVTAAGTLDVKTARIPIHLLVERGSEVKTADILVLARYDDASDDATLLGWAWRAAVLCTAVDDYGHRGILSYGLLATKLSAMEELDWVMRLVAR